MLMPKRVKYRKQQRGRTKGMAQRGNSVAFGDFGLMALEATWVTLRTAQPLATNKPSRHLKQVHTNPHWTARRLLRQPAPPATGGTISGRPPTARRPRTSSTPSICVATATANTRRAQMAPLQAIASTTTSTPLTPAQLLVQGFRWPLPAPIVTAPMPSSLQRTRPPPSAETTSRKPAGNATSASSRNISPACTVRRTLRSPAAPPYAPTATPHTRSHSHPRLSSCSTSLASADNAMTVRTRPATELARTTRRTPRVTTAKSPVLAPLALPGALIATVRTKFTR